MSIDKIKQLESKVQSFENNKENALRGGEAKSAHYYGNLIADTKRKIADLERAVPLESNERLREIISDLKGDNSKLQIQIDELKTKFLDQEERIDKVLHPEKYYIAPPEPEVPIKEVQMIECPRCQRKYKGINGLKTHQRSCKQGST